MAMSICREASTVQLYYISLSIHLSVHDITHSLLDSRITELLTREKALDKSKRNYFRKVRNWY